MRKQVIFYIYCMNKIEILIKDYKIVKHVGLHFSYKNLHIYFYHKDFESLNFDPKFSGDLKEDITAVDIQYHFGEKRLVFWDKEFQPFSGDEIKNDCEMAKFLIGQFLSYDDFRDDAEGFFDYLKYKEGQYFNLLSIVSNKVNLDKFQIFKVRNHKETYRKATTNFGADGNYTTYEDNFHIIKYDNVIVNDTYIQTLIPEGSQEIEFDYWFSDSMKEINYEDFKLNFDKKITDSFKLNYNNNKHLAILKEASSNL